jgi:hypothetical protein
MFIRHEVIVTLFSSRLLQIKTAPQPLEAARWRRIDIAAGGGDWKFLVLVSAQDEVDLVFQFEAPFLHILKLKVLKRLVILFYVYNLPIQTVVFGEQFGKSLIAGF